MENGQRFRDRFEAGRILGEELRQRGYAAGTDVIVLALPRGGVPVGYEVAGALHAPLDVFIVRKVGVPGHEELAMGAIASGGVKVVNEDVLDMLRLPRAMFEAVAKKELREVERREKEYRGDRPRLDLKGKTVILVDDGLATGSTMLAAVRAVALAGAERIVVAVPVAAEETCDAFRGEVDDVICAITPQPFHAVGIWYEDFSQTSDQEVRELLARAAEELSHAEAR
jgi:predicted phosphoribosyltransferase